MIIILPLLPIAIALLCIGLGIFGEIQSNLETINNILMVIVILIFSGIAIYNITRKISVTRKVLSSITCIVAAAISAGVLGYFIRSIAAIEFGIFGLLEFAFVLMIGGSICLLIVIGCIYVCCMFNDT